jgi:hypothetical protein
MANALKCTSKSILGWINRLLGFQMKAVLTGATGFIGAYLLKHLQQPTVLTRNPEKAAQKLPNGTRAVAWDPAKNPAPSSVLNGADVVFHLAGEPVAEGRWSAAKKKAIRESRVAGTRLLVEGLEACEQRPRVLVSTSAVGYYGDRGDEVLTEASAPANDFLAEVCVEWEREAMRAEQLGMRVVTIRTGIVLGKEGALAKMMFPFKMGVGGPLGNGKNWMPWIHVDDLASLYMHAARNDTLRGPMNGSAPNPVINKDFTKAFAAALHRPAFLPIPYFGLRVLFGEFAKILFASQRVLPTVAERTGFKFQYPDIGPALEQIINGDKKSQAA